MRKQRLLHVLCAFWLVVSLVFSVTVYSSEEETMVPEGETSGSLEASGETVLNDEWDIDQQEELQWDLVPGNDWTPDGQEESGSQDDLTDFQTGAGAFDDPQTEDTEDLSEEESPQNSSEEGNQEEAQTEENGENPPSEEGSGDASVEENQEAAGSEDSPESGSEEERQDAASSEEDTRNLLTQENQEDPAKTETEGEKEDSKPQMFTVTWRNYDGSVLLTEQVEEGQMPSYTGVIPERPADEYSDEYTFAGWRPAFSPVTQDTEYTAVYRNRVIISVNSYEGIYDGQYHGLRTSLSTGVSILYSTDNVNFLEEPVMFRDVGTYSVYYRITVHTAAQDYSFQNVNLVRIYPRAVSIRALDMEKEYGDADPELEWEADGLVEGETLTGSLSRDPGEDIGTYTISQGSLTAGSNYRETFSSAVFTIRFNEGELPVHMDSAAFPYDGQAHSLPSAAYGGAPTGETVYSYSLDQQTWTEDFSQFTAVTVADSKTIYVQASHPNYAKTGYCTAELTIEPRPVPVIWGDLELEYTGMEQVPSAEVSGVLEGEECQVVVMGIRTDPGTYTAVAAELTNPNYCFQEELEERTVSYSIVSDEPETEPETETAPEEETEAGTEETTQCPPAPPVRPVKPDCNPGRDVPQDRTLPHSDSNAAANTAQTPVIRKEEPESALLKTDAAQTGDGTSAVSYLLLTGISALDIYALWVLIRLRRARNS